MKILVADKLSEKAVSALKDLGAEVRVNPDLGSDDLPGFLTDSEILIVRSTRVTAAAMEAAQNLSVIIQVVWFKYTKRKGCLPVSLYLYIANRFDSIS